MSKHTFHAFLRNNKGVAGQIDRIKLNADGTAKNKSDFDELVRDITEFYNHWVIKNVRNCIPNGMHVGKRRLKKRQGKRFDKELANKFLAASDRHRSTGANTFVIRKWIMKYKNRKPNTSWVQ